RADGRGARRQRPPVLVRPDTMFGQHGHRRLVTVAAPDAAERVLAFQQQLVEVNGEREQVTGGVPDRSGPVRADQLRRGELRAADAAEEPLTRGRGAGSGTGKEWQWSGVPLAPRQGRMLDSLKSPMPPPAACSTCVVWARLAAVRSRYRQSNPWVHAADPVAVRRSVGLVTRCNST